MKITVFGAAGRVGRHVASQALLRGHDVTAFVRDASGLDLPEVADVGSARSGISTHAEQHVRGEIARLVDGPATDASPTNGPRLDVVVGDARDAESVEEAVRGRDALVSAMALPAPEREFEHSEATRTIVEAALRTGVRRLVVTTCGDVLAGREVVGDRAPFAREDERIRDELRSSRLDWTIAAAPWLTDDRIGTYEAFVDERAPGTSLAVADLATFALDALERDVWIGHVVGVSAAP
jgi:putative NADH-flavin reductase